MTMCKHKSGGMSKPSGAATTHRRDTLNNRTITPCPGHNEQQETNDGSSEMAQGSMTTQTRHPEGSFIQSANGSTETTDLNKTHNENQTSYSMCNGATSLEYNNLSYQVPIHDIKSPESDDDESTESSPMLIQTYVSNYPQQNSFYNLRYDTAKGATNGVYNWTEENPQSRCPSISNGCLVDAQCEFMNKSREQRSCFPRDLDKKRYFDFQNGYLPATQIPYNNGHGRYDNYRSEQNSCSETLCSGRDSATPCSHFPLLCMHSFDLVGSNTQQNSESGQYTTTMALEPMPGPSGVQRPNSVHWEIGTNDELDKDDEFRCRSYSLTPTVNFAVFESESASEVEEDGDAFVEEHVMKEEDQCKVGEDELFRLPITGFHKMLPISPSAAQLSLASSYGDSGASICKICHMTAKENDPLISPCRCSGTMQYIHCGCLMRWLEISSKRSRKPASCELCQYQYHWHKKFKVRHWQFPHCSRRDKVLHFLFFISIIVMIACATVTIMCFKQDKGTKVNPNRTELTNSEIITLVCGVAFFLAFFVAMYVEVKSRSTIYKLLVKFMYLNQQWYIDEYDKKVAAPVAV